MRIIADTKLDFDDVLIVPKRSTIGSRKEVDLKREFTFKYAPEKWRGIPIISANMSSVTNEVVMKIMVDNGMLASIPKTALFLSGLYDFGSISTYGIDADTRPNLVPQSPFICLDIANGYMEKFIVKIEQIREYDSKRIIIAGNVVTPEMTEALILAGADIVKVGLGSGSACATRLKTGIGYPQLSAIIECADAAHGLGGHIIADGGCRTPGDVVKAFGAGADFVMLGGMLANHAENRGIFYGSSSKTANAQNGGLQDYRAAEGFELALPPRGALQDTLQDILGGLRSACSYVGAHRLKDLPKCTTFCKVNRQLNTSLWEYRMS